MLLAVASFVIGGPLVGIGMFFLTWAFAVAAFSPHGVDHTQFHVRGEHDSAPPGEPKARP